MTFPASALVIALDAASLPTGTFYLFQSVWNIARNLGMSVQLTGNTKGLRCISTRAAVLTLAKGWKLEPVVQDSNAFAHGVPVMGHLGVTTQGPAIFSKLPNQGEEIILLPSGTGLTPESECDWSGCIGASAWSLELVAPNGERYSL